MKWQGRQGSSNVEDARGSGGFSGGGSPMVIGGGGMGCLGIIVMIVIALMGGNPMDYMGGESQPTQTQNQQQDNGNNDVFDTGNVKTDAGNDGAATEQSLDDRGQFASVVLKDTEDVWHKIFQDYDKSYTEPKMVLYSDAVRSGCGQASSQMGPFYCPVDQKIYIDLSFMDELDQKFDAPGDFAMAYVIAHEVGHHVQNELGILPKFHQLRNQLSETEYNKYSVAVELQADYFAGVYAKHAQEMGYTDDGDLEEAIKAAHAVGDDTIQENALGRANPDTFTHGSSAERMDWFKRGYEAGDFSQGNTFKARGLDF
ncbi:neutral zinc metallopeptidase [Macrococcoides canis]|uniref:KPN_02809 family neutral zinc metallopeptidase n=1 Tax=Macrococcoides canis TaxID=1855823 RepID=UPI001B8D60BB|nr:neutral zinc metallopeptidase [Macrococcus canis]QUR94199.1 metalloprotease [Macrococcus canis]UTH07287.1 neutral zinc metallopeptidase [Macrococcus canis]